jgi:hypothetical protein
MKDLVPVSEFTSPVRAPEPLVDLRKAITVEEGLQQLTNRTEFLKDTKITGPASLVDREIVIADGTTGKLAKASGLLIDTANEPVYPTAKARTKILMPLGAKGAGWQDVAENAGQARFDLSELPSGAIVSRIRVIIDPGAARSGANRMFMRLTHGTPDFATPDLFGQTTDWTVSDDTTAAVQVLDSDSVPMTPITISNLVAGPVYTLVVQGGNDAATNPDKVSIAEITWTDPGPRNF